jgi:4-hydroxybenzoate polyprenyltransferase
MRPKQWIKNVFVLAPLVFSGEFLYPDSVGQALLATWLFCLASSTVYIINDIFDIEHDRQHPVKSKSRPLAAGIVSLHSALVLLAALYGMLIIGWFMLPAVAGVIIAYLLLNIAYTFVLKHQPVLDIFTVAIGFMLRVYAGAIALTVSVSSWMFVTTLCLALYLAAVKRRQELLHSGAEGRGVLKKYSVALVDRYAEMSATGSLLFYSLFVMSVRQEMVITIPIVLFGLFRYWYVVEELDGGESPADILFTDWQLLLAIIVWGGVWLWMLWPGSS